jgi:hypothetical protein
MTAPELLILSIVALLCDLLTSEISKESLPNRRGLGFGSIVAGQMDFWGDASWVSIVFMKRFFSLEPKLIPLNSDLKDHILQPLNSNNLKSLDIAVCGSRVGHKDQKIICIS